VTEKNLYQARASNRLSQRLKTDKRGELRHSLALPVKVAGSDCHKDPWSELAETVNVSTGGLALRLSRKVMIGEILSVKLALPPRFQTGSNPSAAYTSNARVLYIEMRGHQQIVRLQFLRTPTHSRTTRSEALLVSAKF
jgi:hypothetical protein